MLKKLTLLMGLQLIAMALFAQSNSFPNVGSVGIGTSAPLAKLDVRGEILVKNLLNQDNESVIMISQSLGIGPYTTFGTSLRTFTQSAGMNSYALQFFTQENYLTGQTEKLRIAANGNVGIGTSTPQEKLSVNGKIRAKEIKVEAVNWPDYVFEEEYQLRDLEALEKYIKQNKHLPEIPSAKEVEANGIALGELNKLLLKKVEELTLHLIEKDKEVKTLKSAFDALQQTVNQLVNQKK